MTDRPDLPKQAEYALCLAKEAIEQQGVIIGILLRALVEAKKVVDVAEKMRSCRAGDDWIWAVWAVQGKVDAALASAKEAGCEP